MIWRENWYKKKTTNRCLCWLEYWIGAGYWLSSALAEEKPGCFSRKGLTKLGTKSSFSARDFKTFSSSFTIIL